MSVETETFVINENALAQELDEFISSVSIDHPRVHSPYYGGLKYTAAWWEQMNNRRH